MNAKLLFKVGVVGAAGAGKTTYSLSVLGEPREPTPTLFLDLYPPFLIFDVLNEGPIKIKGQPSFAQIYDEAGNPILKEYSLDILGKYIPTLDIILFVIDGIKIKESIADLENRWVKYVTDDQIKATIVTKMDDINFNIKKNDIFGGKYNKNELLEECLKFCKKRGSSYLSIVESLYNPREEVIYSNGKELVTPVEVKIGGAITVPLVNSINKEHSRWLENTIYRSYFRKGFI